jgi:hypothetical protein
MGLDLAVGVLYDGAGDDRYSSQVIAQGAATANGVGMVIDGGGADSWAMGSDPRSWGNAGWARGLPSLALLLQDRSSASYTREGGPVQPPEGSGNPGGARGEPPAGSEPPIPLHCAPVAAADADTSLPLADALRGIETGFAGGSADSGLYAAVQRRLMTRLEESIAAVPHDDFSVVWSFSMALRCAFAHATDDEAQAMWNAVERVLAGGPAVPLAGPLTDAVRTRPPSVPQAQRILSALDRHPWCSVRTSALRLREAITEGEASRAAAIDAARAALHSSCWGLQAAGLRVLAQLGEAPRDDVRIASFLH